MSRLRTKELKKPRGFRQSGVSTTAAALLAPRTASRKNRPKLMRSWRQHFVNVADEAVSDTES